MRETQAEARSSCAHEALSETDEKGVQLSVSENGFMLLLGVSDRRNINKEIDGSNSIIYIKPPSVDLVR